MQKSSILTKVSVVGSLATWPAFLQLDGSNLADQCDIVELRLDAWPKESEESVRLAANLPVPVLITARNPAEGGMNDLSTVARQSLIINHLPYATLVDVELSSLGELTPVLEACQHANVPVVGSYHCFTGQPSFAELQKKVEIAKTAGFAAVKMAVTPHKATDLAALLKLIEFAKETLHLPISVMGMGEYGKISRLLLAKAGSALNYGYLDKATVPGQWAAPTLKARLAEI